MKVLRVPIIIGMFSLLLYSAGGEEDVDYKVVSQIREEGFSRSQVMDIAGYMSDVLGPRFSNSAGYTAAAEWAKRRFEEFGISAEMQASVILASFAYHAAMRDQMLPRSPNQIKNNRRWHK